MPDFSLLISDCWLCPFSGETISFADFERLVFPIILGERLAAAARRLAVWRSNLQLNIGTESSV